MNAIPLMVKVDQSCVGPLKKMIETIMSRRTAVRTETLLSLKREIVLQNCHADLVDRGSLQSGFEVEFVDRPEWKDKITFLSDLVKSGDVHINSDDVAKAALSTTAK